VTPGRPSQLAFTTQPGNVGPGAVIAPAVVVQLRDAYGNVVDHDKFARELVPAITKAIGDGVA